MIRRVAVFITSIMVIQASFGRELVILTDPFPPWQFAAADGAVQGINIDLLQLIAKNLQIKIRFKHQPWTRAWVSVKRAEADIVLSASRKKSRERYLLYPELGNDLRLSRYVFFYNTHNQPSGMDSYQDIIDNNLAVCIVNGYSYQQSFWQAFPYTDNVAAQYNKYTPDRRDYNQLLTPAKDPAMCVKLLAKQRVDLVISDQTIGQYEAKKLKLNVDLQFQPGDIVSHDTTLFAKGYPISVVKKSSYPDIENVAKQLWQELIVIKNSGAYQKIMDSWLN